MIDIKRLIQSRVAEFDPFLKTDDGSAFYNTVIKPLEALFAADPLQTDARVFLKAKLAEAYPDLPISEGDALNDVLVNAVSLFFNAYRTELQNISRRQSVTNVSVLADEDVDDLAANWLVSRKSGARATSSVRVTVSSATPISVTQAVLFTTPSGISFSPDGNFTITAQELLQRQISPRQFYYDIPVIAVEEGEQGNVPIGTISSVLNLNNVISVSNTVSGSGGRDSESSDTLVRSRLSNAVSERSLVTARGASAQLLTDSADILGIYVAGMGDANMQRDAVDVRGTGPLIAGGVAVLDASRTTAYLLLNAPTAPVSAGNVIDLRVLNRDTYAIVNTVSTEVSSVIGQARASAVTLCVISIPPDPTLLRLDVGEHLACVCAISEPPTLLVDGERIGAGASFGGRSDIHINPDADVLVTSEFELVGHGFVYSGLGARASGIDNILHISGVPLGADCLGLYIKVDGHDQFYRVIYQDVKGGEHALTLDRVISPSIAAVTASRWRLFMSVAVAQGGSLVHAPLPSGSLSVSGLIGAVDIRYDSSDRLETLNMPTSGLTLVIYAEDTISLAITQISDRIVTASPLPLTLSGVRAEIIEALPQLPLPLTHINSMSIGGNHTPRARSVGVRLLGITEPKVTQQGLVGHVSPKLHYAFGSERRIAGSVAAPLLRTLGMDSDSYVALQEGGSASPYELGIARPRSGACAVRVALPRGDNTIDYIDVTLPTELFVPGRYNIFVGVGNISYADLSELISSGFSDRSAAPFPLNMQRPIDATSGDILEIEVGNSRGSYIIDEVFDIEIPVGPLRTLTSVGMNEGTVSAYSVDRSCVLRLSVVRVYGEFSAPPTAALERDMRIATAVEPLSGSTTVHIDALLRCLMAPELLVSSTSALESAVSSAISERVGVPYPTSSLSQLPTYLGSGAESTYRVGKPGVGMARLMFQSAGTPRVYLPYLDYVSHWTVNSALASVANGDVVDVVGPARKPSQADRGVFGLVFDSNFESPRTLGGERADDPLTWGRDMLFTPGDAGAGLRVLRPSAVDNVGLIALGVDQDEYGYDVVELPERYGPVGAEIDAALGDELWTLPEALFTEHATFTETGEFLGRLVSNTRASGELLVKRGGVLLFEPQVPTRPASVSVDDWNNFVRSEWDIRRTVIAADQWAYVRDLISSAEASTGYARLSAMCEDGTIYSLKNLNGQNVLEWLSSVALQQPESVMLVSTRAQLLALSPAPVPRAAEIFRRVSRISSVRKYGLPTIVTQRGSATVYVNKVSGMDSDVLPELTQDLVGSYVYIDQGPDSGGYTVRSVSPDTRSITLDRPLQSSTPMIDIIGVCGVNSRGGTVKVSGFTSALDGLDPIYKYPTRIAVVDDDYAVIGSYAASMVTSRLLTQGDVNKYMTLYNYVQESGTGSSAPIRSHLGSFKIMAVTDVKSYDSSVGRMLVVSQLIKLDNFEGVATPDYSRCFFAVSAETIAPDVGELKGLRPIHVYESEPLKYPIIAAETEFNSSGGRRVAVITSGGLIPSAVTTLGPLAQVDTSRDQLNPTTLVRLGEASVSLSSSSGIYSADLHIKTRTLSSGYLSTVGGTYITDVRMPGYDVSSEHQGLAFSTRESLTIRVDTPGAQGAVDIESMYAPAVYSAQNKMQLTSNRVVCADLLARRMTPAYVGVRFKYVGAVSESSMRKAVEDAVRTALTSSGALSASDIIAIAYQRGATKVGQPIDMFYVVEGRDRQRHIEYVTGTLSAASITGYVGSIETTSVRAGTDIARCLGVDISVTRVASVAQLGD